MESLSATPISMGWLVGLGINALWLGGTGVAGGGVDTLGGTPGDGGLDGEAGLGVAGAACELIFLGVPGIILRGVPGIALVGVPGILLEAPLGVIGAGVDSGSG